MSDRRKRLTVIVTRAGAAAALGALLFVRAPEEESLLRATAALPSPRTEHTRLSLSAPDGGPTPQGTVAHEVSRAQKEAAESAPPPIAAAAVGGPARFSLRDGSAAAFFTDCGVAISLSKAGPQERDLIHEPELSTQEWGLHWSVDGASPVEPRTEGELPGRVNSFIGSDPARWKTDQATFSRIVYDEVRPGMDLSVESRRYGLKYTITLEAGSYTGPIRLRYEGAEELRIVDGGSALEIQTGAGVVREDGLVCYQPASDGRRLPLSARYVGVMKEAGELAWSYTIELDDVDSARPVVIDPVITWSTFLRGAAAAALAVDGSGNVHVVGTASGGTFPLVGAFNSSVSGYTTAVAKFSSDGSRLIWSSYLGVVGQGADIAVDGSGNVYVTGHTWGDTFPIVGGLGYGYGGRLHRAYVAKIDASGSGLVWSSLVGGYSATDGWERNSFGHAIALDGAANVYVTGIVGPTTGGFGTPGSFDETHNGDIETFVVKINASGSSLAWGGYLGGTGYDYGYDIAVDGTGHVYVVGITNSANFPVTAGFDSSLGAGYDGFIAKISASGAAIVWSSYVGGSSTDLVSACAVDGAGNVYLGGATSSTDFPISGGFDSTLGGTWDAFVMKLAASGTTILWSSYLGGSAQDSARNIALNGSGNLYVTGHTESVDFPIVNALDPTYGGGGDAFVAKLDPLGSSFAFSTYLGGSQSDNGAGIALSDVDILTICGNTGSADFPTTAGAFQPVFVSGYGPLFVTRIENGPPTVSAPSPANGAILTSSTPVLSGTVSVKTGLSVLAEFSIDGGPFIAGSSVITTGTSTFVPPPFAEGPHTWSFRARDELGNISAVIGPHTMVIDITPPAAGSVHDGADRDVDVQSSTTRINANWKDFTDSVTALTMYEWGIGTSPGAGDIQPFTSVGLATSSTTPDLSLSPGTTYFVTVRATNAAGLSTTVSSDGVLVETTDSTPPAAPAGLRIYPGHQTLAIEWDPSPSSDVTHYILWWKASAAPWTDAVVIAGLTSRSTTLTGLTDGSTYDLMLRSVDGAGNESPVLADSGMPCAVKIQGGGLYSSLQDALSAALPGQTILVGTGVHAGNFMIPGGVSLTGMSPRYTHIAGSGGSVLTLLGMNGVHGPTLISNLTLEGGSTGLNAGNSEARLDHLVIHHMSGYGVMADFGGKLEVINCTVMSNGLDGVASFAATTVRNSIVGGNAGVGLNVPSGSAVTHNDVYLNGVSDVANGVSGSGNFFKAALFTDEPACDYTEQSASPTVDAGDPADDASLEPTPNSGRINIGAFGNTPWAASLPIPAPDRPKRERRCGLLGLDALAVMGLLRLLRRPRRKRGENRAL